MKFVKREHPWKDADNCFKARSKFLKKELRT